MPLHLMELRKILGFFEPQFGYVKGEAGSDENFQETRRYDGFAFGGRTGFGLDLCFLQHIQLFPMLGFRN